MFSHSSAAPAIARCAAAGSRYLSVNANAPGDRWIGLTDRFGLAPGATESNDTADKLTMGWAWANGEPFTYQNWNPGEPNDAGGEDAGQMVSNGGWNDNGSGYDAETIISEG